MKYVKTFEYVRNTKYSKYLANEFIESIKRIDKMSYIQDVHNSGSIFGNFWFVVNPKFENEIVKLIPKFKYKASRMGLMFYTSYDKKMGKNFSGTIKEPRMKRVKPSEFVYHNTNSKYANKILKDGLKIDNSKPNRWSGELYYPNAIFASMEDEEFTTLKGNIVTLKIDTKHLPNKWWVDLNFYSPDYNISFRNFIMTFEDIPPEYISIEA